MTYEGILISEDTEAGLAWERIIRDQVDADERNHVHTDLLVYCRQDTLAMARLLDTLLRV